MSTVIEEILLWLFVVNLGVAFGAGLYEHRIVVPGWITVDRGGMHWNGQAARRDDVGLRFWAYVTTGPLTLLTLANLAAAWIAPGIERRWWLAAALVILIERVVTFAYFIPTMIGLTNALDSPAAMARARRWLGTNYMRHALVLGGWLMALKAFSLLYRARA